MKLENLIYESTRKERIYTIGDLEYLSSTQLYSFSGPLGPNLPSSPLHIPKIKPLVSSLPDFSRQFNLLNNYGSEKRETYLEKLERESEESAKSYEQYQKEVEENWNKMQEDTIKFFLSLNNKSQPLSGKGDLYFRDIPSLNDQLHVHPSTGFAKLKKSGSWLSNFDAAMLDLQGENEGGKSGGDNW